MKFLLSELRVHKTLQKSGEFDPALLLGPAPDWVAYKTPVLAHVQADLLQAEVLVTGQATTSIRNTCGRCLKDFEQSLKGQFRQSVDANIDQVDVNEFIKESILLDLPLKALCRPDCKGLCSVCGTNRNEKDCRCQTKQSGSWSAFKDLKVN